MSELSESPPRKEIESLEGGFVCLVDGDGEYKYVFISILSFW